MSMFRNPLMRLLAATFCLAAPLGAAQAATPVKSHPAKITQEDPAFGALIGKHAQLATLYDKGVWSEGIQPMPDGSVIWSDVKANQVLRWTDAQGVEVWLKPSQYQNGHALDPQKRLLAASHGKRSIERLESDGKWHILVDLHEEQKLNSPNDLIVDRSGDIWFSDPAFGISNPKESYGGNPVQGGDYSYRYSPATNTLTRLDTPLVKAPNGLALSPDERTLYIADSEQAYDFNAKTLNHHIVAYDVAADKTLSNGRVLAQVSPGIPDGIKVDEKGNIWSSSTDAVQVFAPNGKRLGKIDVPGTVGNLAFGLNAKTGKPVLYITSGPTVYRLDVNVKGAVMP